MEAIKKRSIFTDVTDLAGLNEPKADPLREPFPAHVLPPCSFPFTACSPITTTLISPMPHMPADLWQTMVHSWAYPMSPFLSYPFPHERPHMPMLPSPHAPIPASVPSKPPAKQPPRFQCPDCSRSYSTFSGLSKHRQFHCVSQLRRQFACKHCDKKYASLGALKMHIRTHTLPCKCHLCGKAFSRPWLLQGHVRTHTGEKPFGCGHCGRAFADRSNLRAHLQTHSDVKKYRCKDCGKTFSRMSLLNKHISNGCPGATQNEA